MADFTLGNIILAHSGKKGILRPNEEGVYRLNAGGFNIENAGGITYPMNQYLKEQIAADSDLNRRVSMGYCKMEVNHPQPFVYVEENGIRYRKPITDIMEWIARLRSYDSTQVCGLISQIIWRPEDPNNLSKPVYTLIDCEPFGERQERFRESLENPRHNTAVSIRTQISPWQPGELRRNVEYWTGFDLVDEPGMIHANKHMTAGCESFLDSIGLSSNAMKFKVGDVLERLDETIRTAANDEEALMRVGGMESLNDFTSMLNTLKRNYRMGDTVRAKVTMGDLF